MPLPPSPSASSGYLSTDVVLWLQFAKVVRLPAARLAEISKLSNRCWLAGIALSLASGCAGLVRVRREARRSALVRGEKEVETKGLIACVLVPSHSFSLDRARGLTLRTFLSPAAAPSSQRAQLGAQLAQDALDLFIPASNLGLVALNDGQVGAIGAVTSWMALRAVWAKTV